MSAEIAIRDPGGRILEKREVIAPRPRPGLLKQAIVRYDSRRRAGTAASKVRSQVVGSRRKPWRQKGTGRARAGDRRSPLWRGGGVIFGPHPRDHSRRLPRRARREALADALHGKLRDGEVIGIEEFPSGEPLKTRRLVELLEGLGLRGSSCLLAVGPAAPEPGGGVPPADDVFSDVRRMARNIPRVSVTRVENLNARDVIRHRCLLLGRAGIEFLFPAEGAPEEEAAS